jgi:hypothetical protein
MSMYPLARVAGQFPVTGTRPIVGRRPKTPQ